MRTAVLLVCMLCGCGRLGFDLGDDDDVVVDANGRDDAADATDAPPAMIQKAQQSALLVGPGAGTLTLAAASTAGTLLVITIAANDVSSLMVPPGWSIAVQTVPSAQCAAAIAYMPNNPGGITSVMYSQPVLQPTIAQLSEWSGIATTSPLDATGSANVSTQSTAQSVQTALATSVSNTLAIDVICEDANMPTYTSGTGWTNLGTVVAGPAEPSSISDYRVVAAPGVVSETVTCSIAGKYGGVIATFLPQ